MLPGIDISEWQGTPNWDQLRADSNVQFVLMRSSFGSSGVDTQFKRNQAEARRVDMPRGFYHFAYPSQGSAEQNAQHFLDTVGPLEPGEVLALDLETSDGSAAFWATFIEYVSARVGFPILGYASLSYFGEHGLRMTANGGCWVAAWNATMPSPPASYPFIAIWQNSDSGTVAGIGGRVDTDMFNGDLAAFHKYGAPGAVTPAPNPAPVPVNPPPAPPTPPAPAPSAGDYIVRRGDTLSGIAAAHGCSLAALEEANRQITNPNLIYPGEVVHLPGGHPNPAPAPAPAPSRVYVVRSGDCLSGIAARLGVSLLALERANPMPNYNLIYPGQVLHIP